MFALALPFAAGCGTGASESEQVSAVVHSYFSSYARASGTELCPLLTASAQHRMVEVVESDERERGRAGTVGACPEAVQFFRGVDVSLFKSVNVLAVSITGTNATVTVKVGSLHAGLVFLSRTATGWLISKLPGEE
jgi:hypothetical protein